MPTHDHDPLRPKSEPEPEEIDASKGFEQTDVGTRGIIVFLAALGIFVVVTAVMCYGIGKVINAHLNKEDGPNSKWAKTVDIRQLGNMPSSPEMQNKVAELTQQFPSPRLQVDDGFQEITDMHAREDLLLENYSWADQSQGKVRIPIERAMEIVAQKGLPVAPTAVEAPLMVGDAKPTVQYPLTDGFARTGYEQDQAQARAAEARQAQGQK
jgi:hypothetical protein